MLTIVFLSFYSEKHIRRHILEIGNSYPVIIVDNSRNFEFQKEVHFLNPNIKFIIPEKNIGFGAAMNLAIKESKTNYVFINSPDIFIKKEVIQSLVGSISEIGTFALLAPTYFDETIHKNYHTEKYGTKNINMVNFLEVDWIDNDFILNKKEMEEVGLFDENFFMYFENFDLCKRILDHNKKMYVRTDLKFIHEGTRSTDEKYLFKVMLSKSWHYCWSKYYFNKKHYGILYALKKIFPNFKRAIKNIFLYTFVSPNKEKVYLSLAEISGILNSILFRKSLYRPFKD